MATIGIDLGTTYSVMSYVDASGQPQIIRNADGATLTPSVVAFLPDGIIVGEEAKEYQYDGSNEIASFFKRSMGDPYFDLQFHGKSYTPIQMSAEVLRKLKQDAEAFLGERVTKAVITVPAYFNNTQREATIEAGRLVGLQVLAILNEPTAAAIAYGLRSDAQEKHILVYDLGGGTFDVTISKMDKEYITVLSTEGDHHLGGKDFDDLLAEYINELFMQEHRIDLFDDESTLNTLLVKVEEAKQKLTSLQRTVVDIVVDRKQGKYEITREKFEQLCSYLVERAWGLVEVAVQNANITMTEIDEIILVGGSTRMPMIAQYIERKTGIQPKYHLNVDEVVAFGAAIQAALLDMQQTAPRFALGSKKVVKDVMSHSLGLIAANEAETKYINSIVIPKNKEIPATVTKTYALRTRQQRENTWDVYVTQGESDDPFQSEILGKYTVRNIPYTKEQPTKLTMTFGYDTNGVMQIEAHEKSTNTSLEIQVEKEIGDTSWLFKSPKEMEQVEPVNVMLVIDTSGSMDGDGIQEAKKAAKAFVEKLSDDMFSIGLVAFADQVEIIQSLTQKQRILKNKIEMLHTYVTDGVLGYGTGGQPLAHLLSYLQKLDGKTIVLLLTDGHWFEAESEIRSAKKLSALDVDIIAVGTDSADTEFLKKIATSDENALFVNIHEVVQSFSNIAKVVSETYKLTSR